MKTILTGGFLIFCLHHIASAQHTKEMAPGYYVVVAAFSPDRQDLAENFTQGLQKKGLKALYGFNSERGYFYVYKNFYGKRQPSIAEMEETRKQPDFQKAWVRKVRPFNKTVTTQVQKTDPEIVNTPPVESSPLVAPVEQTPPQPEPVVMKDTSIVIPVDEENSEVFLNLFNAQNNQTIEGKVKVVNTEKASLLKEVKGNDFLDLDQSKATPKKLTLIAEAFGYRKSQVDITYPMTLADTSQSFVDLMAFTFIINFDLVRYVKGDIATLYQVFFYNDAALMLPESKFELNSLLTMMQENPKYRIRLHGHTNGNYSGKIVVLGDNKNFFSLEGSKKTSGSAKSLSQARASIIKDYLVDNGVDPSRIEVKAWGGKRPLYDKHSNNARKNVRVEVEVLDN
jgi:outer membrane protein OmpA-like peptidoglycan-associated protein